MKLECSLSGGARAVDMVSRELEKYKVDVVALQEIRWSMEPLTVEISRYTTALDMMVYIKQEWDLPSIKRWYIL